MKTAVELGQMDGNNTRAIGDGQSLPTAVCLGYDNDNGKMLSLDVDSDARLNVNPIGGATETTLAQVKTAVEVGACASRRTPKAGIHLFLFVSASTAPYFDC